MDDTLSKLLRPLSHPDLHQKLQHLSCLGAWTGICHPFVLALMSTLCKNSNCKIWVTNLSSQKVEHNIDDFRMLLPALTLESGNSVPAALRLRLLIDGLVL